MKNNTIYKLSLYRHALDGLEIVGLDENLGYYKTWESMFNCVPIEVVVWMDRNHHGWRSWKFTKLGPGTVDPADMLYGGPEAVKNIVFVIKIDDPTNHIFCQFYVTKESTKNWQKIGFVEHGHKQFCSKFGTAWWNSVQNYENDTQSTLHAADAAVGKPIKVNPRRLELKEKQQARRKSSEW